MIAEMLGWRNMNRKSKYYFIDDVVDLFLNYKLFFTAFHYLWIFENSLNDIVFVIISDIIIRIRMSHRTNIILEPQ